jgi:hypothetical protein
MTDESGIPITDPNNVQVIFCNALVGSGQLNGVINITLGVTRFSPQGNAIVPDLIIASRLRLDFPTAVALRDALSATIEQSLPPANGTAH